MKKYLLSLLVLLVSVAANAQTGIWANDKYHSRVGFEVLHGGVSLVSGQFNDFDIQVDAQGQKFEATKINVTIQTSSIDTYIDARDNHLRSADFFEVEKYPTMTFTSTRFVKQGKSKAKIYGQLTLRGITKPVVLNAQLLGQQTDKKSGKTIAGFRLRGTINRSDFGLGPKFLPDAIGNKVNIIFDGEFTAP